MASVRRFVMRAGAAGALATGLVAASAASASATGDNCDGVEVPRCVYIVVDGAGGVAAHAAITDAGGGRNFDVAVNNIRLEIRTSSGAWATLPGSAVGDYDGWHSTYDTGSSHTINCQSGSATLRGAAYMQYTGAASGAYTIYTLPVSVSCSNPV